MSRLEFINETYPTRRTKVEKDAFAAYVTENYSARVEVTSDGKNKNLVIGDPARASVVCTAHYDTPAASLFPNLMIPRNPVLFFAYQFLMVGVLLAVSLAGGALAGALTGGDQRAFLLGYLILYYLLYFLMFRAFENKHNANDNTSGVATVLSLAERGFGEEVAFILFDNEEGGKKGSKAYFKDHSSYMQNKFLVNFDCVGNGEELVFIARKDAEGREELARLKAAFRSSDAYTAHFFPERGSQCNSDHKNFPCGVGCMACRRTRRGLLYTPYIHTGRDTVASADNVRYITDRMCEFLEAEGKE